ncbi:MAG: SDR family oxidoreductase [Clostridia bacterium]|nr:SDR family oxidoreductase [Clostridia bacterium]
MKRFENYTAMVTGGGRNIGEGISLAFANAGANVIVCDLDGNNAKATVEKIEAMGGQAMAAVFDVRDREAAFKAVADGIERFGKIDCLVNNAGGSAWLLRKLSDFVDADPDVLDFVLDINIKGTMNCTQAVLPSMIENKCGKIISMSSIAGIVGLPGRTDYSAAKAAIIGFTKALAMEVGQYNICVNCIAPGAIERDGNPFEHMTHLGENGHGGKPSDIADTVLFLAENNYITGENIVVDGGRTLGVSHR